MKEPDPVNVGVSVSYGLLHSYDPVSDSHLHVGLTTAKPNLTDKDVLQSDFVAITYSYCSFLKRGLRRVYQHFPLPGNIRLS